MESISKLPKFMFRSSGESGVSGVIDLGESPEEKGLGGYIIKGRNCDHISIVIISTDIMA